MSNELASPSYSSALGGGLIRRWSTAADTEKLAWLMGAVFRDEHDEMPNPRLMGEARLLMQPTFPYMAATDMAVVEDTGKPERPLVASIAFWRGQWSYAGIPFGMTQPEMVATDPAYRKRGLVRALFEMIHARSAAEGHLLQGITGIPYFYRQFGYDYALDLDGSRTTYFSLIPTRKGAEPEPCSLRLATSQDVEQIVALYTQRRRASLVWHEAPASRWLSVITAWDDPAVREQDVRRVGINGRYWMILNVDQAVCGYAWVATRRAGRALTVRELAFVPGVDLPRLVPALLRRLRDQGQQTPAFKPDAPPCSEISFQLGRTHPVYDLLGVALAPLVEPPYAWYVRIPDLLAFLRHIAPALEARLAHSVLAGYTGRPKIDLYREGLQLHMARGALIGIESWRPGIYEDDDEKMLSCPPLTFLQVLLGYRSLDELCAIFPDVWVKDEYRLLANTLFPRQASHVEPLGYIE